MLAILFTFVMLFSFVPPSLAIDVFDNVVTSQEIPPGSKINLKAKLKGDTVVVSLGTNLPDKIKVSVDVYRIYYEVGNTAAYTHEYFSERSTVANWKKPRQIPIDDRAWKRDLIKYQKKWHRFPK